MGLSSHGAAPRRDSHSDTKSEQDVLDCASEHGFTAQDLIDRQARLEAQASEALPFSFDTCTHSLGAIRQSVFACRTCGGGGVCYACSIVCHGDHDLIELFHKRNFRCDCGTPSLYRKKLEHDTSEHARVTGFPACAVPCALRRTERNKGWDCENENRYSQNFDGRFCVCARGKEYDPDTEEETMIQCLVCEEWYHESCVSAGKLLSTSALESVLCDACITSNDAELLRLYAGTRNWLYVARGAPNPPEWDSCPAEPLDGGAYSLYGALPPHPAKRARTETQCTLPKRSLLAVHANERADVYLVDGFRDRICRCADCLSRWHAYPFVLDEEPTYDPPNDEETASSASQASTVVASV
ncbi:hypothetical protein MVES_000876 [Malassezia vespertilionis]|uniref:UBR-type domain-containing protein n=1 Tax=Malassezia vespertilionis TaxID=2020962 RepID=A0A2N1JE50_9BASI|nr:hypothetical protein MVES_000876 [Malassezia vespertilionis]